MCSRCVRPDALAVRQAPHAHSSFGISSPAFLSPHRILNPATLFAGSVRLVLLILVLLFTCGSGVGAQTSRSSNPSAGTPAVELKTTADNQPTMAEYRAQALT